jgi:hypothetical protein
METQTEKHFLVEREKILAGNNQRKMLGGKQRKALALSLCQIVQGLSILHDDNTIDIQSGSLFSSLRKKEKRFSYSKCFPLTF